MKHKMQKLAILLAAAVLLLCSCQNTDQSDPGQPDPDKDAPIVTDQVPVELPLVLTASVGTLPETLKPADCVGDGSATILYHLYENLMRWEDDGHGHAVLAPGQAESFTVETDYLGSATYTFTLRSDILWSDGQAVSAYHFVSAWQRIADPGYNSPYRELMSCIAGYDAVQESGDVSLLKVSATDSRTLVVVLNGGAPYFLTDVCAGAYTMPIRTYLPVGQEDLILSNGPYVVAENSSDEIVLRKNEKYYGSADVTVDELRFIPSVSSEADYAKFREGTLNLTVDLPAAALEAMQGESGWTPEAVSSTYGFVFNTLAAPFDHSGIRAAFHLVIDEQAIIDALNDRTLRPAVGLIPYGVFDHKERSAQELPAVSEGDETTQKPPVISNDPYCDFRTHSEEIVTLNTSADYAADCESARKLLADAGYADGSEFPEVEYLYLDTPENKAIAQLLQQMWKKELGVTVVLRGVTDEEYERMLDPSLQSEGEEAYVFRIAAMEFTANTYNDAGDFLAVWHSDSALNCAGYSSEAFDLLIECSRSASTASIYDAYLHDAEAILLEDAPIVALFYRGSGYALAEDLVGLYRLPNGIFFLENVTKRAN